MKRVAIIGCPGAGKSTLAREIHQQTNLPIIHLDKEFWNPGWRQTEKGEFMDRARMLYKRDEWIVDGNYSSTMDERLSLSDTVFYLDFSSFLCLRRVIGRLIRGFGKDRSDCAEGCPERFDLEFLIYVVSFNKNFRKQTAELIAKHSHLRVHHFRHPKELALYLTANCSQTSF